MIRWTAVSFLAVLMAACAQTTPTHRWASTEQVDGAKYREDHARCQAAHQVNADGQPLDTSDEAFAQYKQCMIDRGYVLTAYRN